LVLYELTSQLFIIVVVTVAVESLDLDLDITFSGLPTSPYSLKR
jgi:hypothetical protein